MTGQVLSRLTDADEVRLQFALVEGDDHQVPDQNFMVDKIATDPFSRKSVVLDGRIVVDH